MLKTLVHILAFTWLVSYVYFVVKEQNYHRQKYNSDDTYYYYHEKIKMIQDEIDNLRKINVEINARLSVLSEELKVQNDWDEPKIKELPEMYEFLRRRIYSNIKEFWYFIISEINELENLVDDTNDKTNFSKIKKMISEIVRSLLKDTSQLSDVDRYSEWRQKNSEKLSNLIQTQLVELQNPKNCNEVRKLVCNYSTLDCGYACSVHSLLNCFVIAYVTNRTLVANGGGSGDNGRTSSTVDGHISWESLFLPLSNENCSVTTAADGETMALEWPGNRNAQVLTLDISRFISTDNPYYPFEIPENLAPALKTLHGDPVVWWTGQFLKFILRPRPSTVEMFDDYKKRMKFQTPIVGVHIARHNEYEPHELDEYMFHVDEYYKIKELGGRIDKRRIYLATDEPTLFEKIQLKYPDYEVISDIKLSKSKLTKNYDFNGNIHNSIIDIHFLSRCDYLVCTFSSDVGRMAYEIMNSLHPDASNRFTSLDELSNYSRKIRQLHVAMVPHQTNETDEIELKQGDLIILSKNHWNGFSSGLNLRTIMRGRFPSFKVAPKMVSNNFSDYPKDVK